MPDTIDHEAPNVEMEPISSDVTNDADEFSEYMFNEGSIKASARPRPELALHTPTGPVPVAAVDPSCGSAKFGNASPTGVGLGDDAGSGDGLGDDAGVGLGVGDDAGAGAGVFDACCAVSESPPPPQPVRSAEAIAEMSAAFFCIFSLSSKWQSPFFLFNHSHEQRSACLEVF
ncbi:hypothetical protein SGO26_18240 [Cupriavidus metallidurans]|uniref:hypothetical protein n=1 Tax=Cupriavidus TaxID=106589 RepID=UPI001F264E96|nr:MULTISPECIES: hypothetical protein [Cupriavidus]